MPRMRGVIALQDESPRSRLLINGELPKFDSIEECTSYLHNIIASGAYGSNPENVKLLHIISTMVSRLQFMSHVAPKINMYNNRYEFIKNNVAIIPKYAILQQEVSNILNLPLYNNINKFCFEFRSGTDKIDHKHMFSLASSKNTFDYIYDHIRSGIYVLIRDNRVCIFAPFVNSDYTNNWCHNLKFDSSDGRLKTYYAEKKKFMRKEKIIPIKKWWCNAYILDNEHTVVNGERQWVGDHYIIALRDMFETTCMNRKVPDCEFFINKRDHPILKKNLTEPYDFLFDNIDTPLTRGKYDSYTPVLSFYSSDKFADIMIPVVEDWAMAVDKVFPNTTFHYKNNEGKVIISSGNENHLSKNIKFIPWAYKKPMAIFRGSATGGGVDSSTNQRLKLVEISMQRPDLIDAKLTSWNMRDKKMLNKQVTYIKPDTFDFYAGKLNYIPLYKQNMYKYAVFVQGHSCANRMGYLLRMGFVVLKVDSTCNAPDMWFFKLLKPYIHYIPVKSDMSDLCSQIEWCVNHDDVCKKISSTSKRFYNEFLTKEPIMDYIQMLISSIHKKMIP